MTNDDIDIEITALLERRKKLLVLASLRREVNALERGNPATNTATLLNVVIEAVAQDFNIDPKLMMSKCRAQELVVPRQAVSYVALRVAPIKTIQLARELKLDHSTISYSARSVEERCVTTPGFRERIEMITSNCISQLQQRDAALDLVIKP